MALVSAILTVGSVVGTILAWWRHFWNTGRRVHYTLITLAAPVFAWELLYWNLLGFRAWDPLHHDKLRIGFHAHSLTQLNPSVCCSRGLEGVAAFQLLGVSEFTNLFPIESKQTVMLL